MFSPPPLNEVDNSQINGKIDNSDTAIKIIWIGMFLKLTFINQLYMDKIFKSICVIIVVWNQDIVGDFVSKDKLVYIDYFRAVAIIFIVLGHSMIWGHADVKHLNSQLFAGWTFAFVFIAGFLFQYLSYKFEYKTYLKKKFTNVIMPYLVTLTPVAFYMAFTLANQKHAFYNYSIPERLISAYLGGYVIQTPLWFVGMISLIFLIAPILIYLKKYPKLWYSVLCISWLYSMFVPRSSNSVTDDQGLIVMLLSMLLLYIERVAYFLFSYLIGMEFSTIFENHSSAIKNYSTKIIYALIPLWMTILVVIMCNYKNLCRYQTCIKFVATCIVLLLLFKFEQKIKQHSFWDKALKLIANYSFGIFFIHSYFINIIKKHCIYNIPGGNLVDVSSNTFQSFAISITTPRINYTKKEELLVTLLLIII